MVSLFFCQQLLMQLFWFRNSNWKKTPGCSTAANWWKPPKGFNDPWRLKSRERRSSFYQIGDSPLCGKLDLPTSQRFLIGSSSHSTAWCFKDDHHQKHLKNVSLHVYHSYARQKLLVTYFSQLKPDLGDCWAAALLLGNMTSSCFHKLCNLL